MGRAENSTIVFRPSHKPWKLMKPIPTTGMVRRLFHRTGYLGWQEVHHGDFDDWHRLEQDYLSRYWAQHARRDCAAEEVFSQAITPIHFESAADAHWHGGLWRRTLSWPRAANSRA